MARRLKQIKKKRDDEELLGIPPGKLQGTGPGKKAMHRNEHGLTEQQEEFVRHYIREVNATLSAKLAGYSQQTAGEIGYELLRVPHIQARINALRLKVDRSNDGLREKIINKLMVMADLDIASIYKEDGSLKPVHEWDLEARTSVVGIDTTEDLLGFNKTKKVKLSERTKALDMLIKMQGYNAPEKIANTDLEGNHVPAVININVVPPQKE